MERSHTLTAMILGMAVVLMPGAQACAQWGSAPVVTLTPAQQIEWDKRRAEGKTAAQAFQWAKARDAYQKAWAIKQDWKVAANLGRSELNLSKHRDAAEHLTYALREAPQSVATEAPEEWNDLREMLARARARVGALVINVEPAGAEVLVNGLPVGKAPLPGAVFVEPGPVVVEARAAGYALANASMKVAAGKEEPVRLVLVSSWKKSEAPSAKPSTNERDTRTGALDEVTSAGIALAGAAGLMGVGFGAAIPSYKPHHGDQISPLNMCLWSFVGAGAVSGATAIYALTRKTGATSISVGYQGTGLLVSGQW